MSKIVKTNAMRILDKEKITYKIINYDVDDGVIDGISVAIKTGKMTSEVYKTLVAQGNSKEYYVFVIPVDKELDLKKAANVVKEKKIEMLQVKDLLPTTGYIRGGCSPIGMKKLFKTFFQEDMSSLETITISGGKIGTQIELAPQHLLRLAKGEKADLIK